MTTTIRNTSHRTSEPQAKRSQFLKQEDFEKSASGRAAKAQMTAMAKQSAAPKTGEPVLKWQMSGSEHKIVVRVICES
ncbi:hypothetical protein MKW98_012250 [Papaver atlanticum]|uniref:Uncharacterized protein n=1 Tax=Papaver atlanticum TaxID=357466 RepID=A0AAD4T1Y2_9MAGN|nr:hypothetical protein MKW98_012250 [Papaver atlanticum]